MTLALAGLAVLIAGAIWRLWALDRALVRLCGQRDRGSIAVDARMDQFWDDVRRLHDDYVRAVASRGKHLDDAVHQLAVAHDRLDERIAALEPWVRHFASRSREASE